MQLTKQHLEFIIKEEIDQLATEGFLDLALGAKAAPAMTMLSNRSQRQELQSNSKLAQFFQAARLSTQEAIRLLTWSDSDDNRKIIDSPEYGKLLSRYEQTVPAPRDAGSTFRWIMSKIDDLVDPH